MKQVERWDRSRKIREYVADLKANAHPVEQWKMGDEPLCEWMDWALRHADSIDPVAPIRKARQNQATVQTEPPATEPKEPQHQA